MKNTSIALSDHWQKFIAAQVESGRFGSASEVVREGLRLAEDRQKRIERLGALIEEGEASGFIANFDFSGYVDTMLVHEDANVDEKREAA